MEIPRGLVWGVLETSVAGVPVEGQRASVSHAPALGSLEVWPESHWPGFALRQADAIQS